MKNKLLEIATSLKPKLINKIVYPIREVKIISNNNAFQSWKFESLGSIEDLTKRSLKSNDNFTIDFGNHQVGYINLSISPQGSHPDAPLRLKLKFGEMPCEIGEPFENYNGWLSKSWLQEEIITIDVLPCKITLPRRYAFRYLHVDIIATSQKYSVQFKQISVTTVTSADIRKILPLPNTLNDTELTNIDRVSIKTLHDCMQSVFEDGPKRDRRLWIGDLRLQALANYYTFKNYDLVKRCLYFFAALPEKDGKVGANVFLEPEPEVDDTVLYDYSLFFVSILYDYYFETKDIYTLVDLWSIAMLQINLALQRIDERGIVRDDNSWWSFIDWNDNLNKQTPSQGVLIYVMKQAKVLADILMDEKSLRFLDMNISFISQASIKYLYDSEQGFFISGEQKQVSFASQVWMVLAQVFNSEGNGQLIDNLFKNPPKIRMVTPYMYHHLIEALIISDRKKMALNIMKGYWGKMISYGADCFFEIFNPNNEFESPYGSILINSYCHAWSCTPTYFIRKYFV